MKITFCFITLFLFITQALAQQDTVKYQWPVPPLTSSQPLNATFCEFRNTLSSDHFHNGVDIGEPDGNPCYASMDGQVHYIDNSGSNGYVSVATQINGQWKRITYLHINPNPSLSVGQSVVTGVTVIGTIYPGMGHIHSIERELISTMGGSAAEINPIRFDGGLTPYNDPYAPVINRSSLKFFIDGTDLEVPSYGLTGRIDIQVEIEERNGTSGGQQNNGTYLAGYRVWSADTSTIVYEPADAGIKYRFDRRPINSYVHQVFVNGLASISNPVYWLTNGSGANSINQTRVVTNNYFQASLLDTGNYVLEIFSEDTRGNQDVEYFSIGITDQDLTPPSTPEVFYILNTNQHQSLQIKWQPNGESDLLGYRLYYSPDNQLSNWELAADEFQITRDSTFFYINSPDSFIVVPGQDVYYFKLTALDSSGNESDVDDIYGRSVHADASNKRKVLIVNGFTRYGGSASWQNPTHPFVKSYCDALVGADSVVVSSCSNEAIVQNLLALGDFDIVIWFVGDESTYADTFTPAEQNRIKSYLENGGKLMVSGSEIGWDLGRTHTYTEPGDLAFYNNYFKASYIYDGNTSMSPAVGISGTMFDGTQLNYGIVYPEDYPDDIDPANGSQVVMRYSQIRSGSTYRRAGVAFTGTFGASSTPGQMVYLTFPFETVNSLTQRQNFMTSLLNYFGGISGIDEPITNVPNVYSLSQNYPNPFNPSTHFTVNLPEKQKLVLRIYDILGREVQTLANDYFTAGEYKFTWNARAFASGVYLIEMRAGAYFKSRKMLLLK